MMSRKNFFSFLFLPLVLVFACLSTDARGTSSQDSQFPFSFWGSFSTVTSVVPDTGFLEGGQAVTINGTGFAVSPTVVSLGGTSLTGVVRVSATQITGTTGAHAGGAVNAVVDSATLVGGYNYFDPSVLPGASATCLVYITSRHVTTVAGPVVSAAADQSGHGNNATAAATRPSYTASDATFNNFPSISMPSGTGVNPLIFAEPSAGATRSFAMVGITTAAGALNNWFSGDNGDGCIGIRTAASTHLLTSTSTISGTSLIWGTAAGNASAAIAVSKLVSSTNSKFWVNAQTGVSGNAGVAVIPQIGQNFNIGARLAGADTQNMAGRYTDFLMFDGGISDSDASYLETSFGKIYNITIQP